MLHDLICFVHPETMPTRFARYSRWQTCCSAHCASGIVCNSWTTLRDLAHWVPGTEEKAVVIYAGVEEERFGEPESFVGRCGETSGLEWMQEPYFLAVGMDPRKNHFFLVEAYLDARERCSDLPKLVIVGGESEESGKIRDYARARSAEGNVCLPGYLSDSQLSMAYAKADLLLFPSLYEGFGYPPLEAMKVGTPVLASNRGSMAEVVGDAGLLLDPEDSTAWRDGMVKIWRDRAWREQWVQRGLKRVSMFSSEGTAARILQALEGWR